MEETDAKTDDTQACTPNSCFWCCCLDDCLVCLGDLFRMSFKKIL